jgi:hypothetical protein
LLLRRRDNMTMRMMIKSNNANGMRQSTHVGTPPTVQEKLNGQLGDGAGTGLDAPVVEPPVVVEPPPPVPVLTVAVAVATGAVVAVATGALVAVATSVLVGGGGPAVEVGSTPPAFAMLPDCRLTTTPRPIRTIAKMLVTAIKTRVLVLWGESFIRTPLLLNENNTMRRKGSWLWPAARVALIIDELIEDPHAAPSHSASLAIDNLGCFAHGAHIAQIAHWGNAIRIDLTGDVFF